MATYVASRIEKPKHFRLAPLRRGRGRRSVHVIGFDSEAENGEPFLFQFSRVGTEKDVDLRVIPRRRYAALDTFMTYIHDYCTRKDTEYIIVGWNLRYEFTQVFGDLPTDLNSQDEYEFTYTLRNASDLPLAKFSVHVMAAKRYAVVITNLATKRRVRFMDGAAYYVTSLDNAAAMLGIGRKIEIASKRFTRADLDNETFRAYARQDAWLTRKIGEEIVSLHETYDVPTCITAPHFAARVFRRQFLTREIPLPSEDVEQAGLSSYHGGKNGYYLDGPAQLDNIYAFDITSAYPEAMRQLPDPTLASWDRVSAYTPRRHAIYRINGYYQPCQWRGIMQHHNAWHNAGQIEDTWITSYELDEAIAQGEFTLTSCEGWEMHGPLDGPLVAYVDRFFSEKRTTTGARRAAAKLFLNSLYGKFFQKIPLGTVGYWDAETLDDNGFVRFVESNPSQEFDWQAGGLYHPPIASLITGFVRAKIHRLEHRYDAIMTSTDGFFARKPAIPNDLGSDLGLLTVEHGTLRIWRERLYHFLPSNGSAPKYALHGFRGTVDELLAIPLARGAYEYEATQVITNKLATLAYRGTSYRPGTFARLRYTLDLTG